MHKIPTLEELKQHFQNAELVGDADSRASSNTRYTIDWDKVYLSKYNNWCLKGEGCLIQTYLWSKGQYAEIVKYNSKQMKNRTITPQQAQRIINITCAGWKRTLAGKWASDIVLQKDIVVTDEYYKTMRAACTSDQHEVFDEIFGRDSQVKAGDWVTITQECTYTGKTFQVTQEMIDNLTLKRLYDFEHTEYGSYRMGSQARLAIEEEIKKATQIVPQVGKRYKLRYTCKFCHWYNYQGNISINELESCEFMFLGEVIIEAGEKRSLFMGRTDGTSYAMFDCKDYSFIAEELK